MEGEAGYTLLGYSVSAPDHPLRFLDNTAHITEVERGADPGRHMTRKLPSHKPSIISSALGSLLAFASEFPSEISTHANPSLIPTGHHLLYFTHKYFLDFQES